MEHRIEALEMLAGAGSSGQPFFDLATQALTRGLDCRWAGIGLLDEDSEQIDLIACAEHDDARETVRYGVETSPCGRLYIDHTGNGAAQPSRETTWPLNGPTPLGKIENGFYRGRIIVGEDGAPLGHVFAACDQGGQEDPEASRFFNLVWARVAAELRRWRREQQIQQMGEQLGNLTNEMPVMMWGFDSAFNPTFFNRATLAFLGFTEAQALEQGFFHLIHDEDRDRVKAEDEAGRAARSRYQLEYRLRRADGSYRWIIETCVPHYASDGSYTGCYGFGMDITEQKQTFEALQVSEARLSAVLNNAPVAMSMKDKSGRFIFVNEQFEDWFGSPVQDIIGRTADELFSAEVADICIAQDWEALSSNGPVDQERRLVLDDGSMHVMLVTKFPVSDAHGDPIGVCAFYSDITERKRVEAELRQSRISLEQRVAQRTRELAKQNRALSHEIAVREKAEHALRESETRFREFAASTSDWFWEMDETLRFSYVSERFSEMTGMSGDGILGKTWHEAGFAGVDATSLTAHVAELDAHRPFRNFIHPSARPDGTVVYLSMNGRPCFDETGRFFGYRGAVADVSEVRRAEVALREREQEAVAARAMLEDALEQMADGFAFFDAHDRLVLCNRKYREIFSVVEDLLVPGIRFVDLAMAAHRRGQFVDSGISLVDFVAQRLKARDAGDTFLHQTSAGRWIEARDHRIENGSLVCIRIDITERKNTEQALRRTEAMYKHAERLASLGHWEWDEVEDQCLYCSDELARLHGVSRDEYLRRAVSTERDLEWVHPEDRAYYHQVCKDAVERRRGFDIEYRLILPDGTSRDVREVAEMIVDDAGNLMRSNGFVQDITERKRFEAAIKETEERFRRIFEDSAVGTAVAVPDDAQRTSRFVQVNKAFCDMLGYTENELLGMSVHDLTHPDDRPTNRQIRDEISKRKLDSYHIEKRHIHKDGHTVWVQLSVSVIRDAEGNYLYTIGHHQDITARKRVEQTLRKTDALYRKTERLARIGHWESDRADGRYTYCSDELGRICGLSVPALVAANASSEAVLDWVHRDDRERYVSALEAARQGNGEADIEFRLVRRDGETLYARELVEFQFNDDGTVKASFGCVQDITAQKEAEKALRESETAHARAQRVAKIGHWEWAIDSDRLTSCSEEVARIHGVSMEQVVEASARQLTDFVHPEDRELVERQYDIADEQGLDYEIEYRIVRPGGDIRYVQEIGEAVFDDRGRAVSHVGTMQDITERRQAEEALRESEARYRSIFDGSPISIWEEDWSRAKPLLEALRRQDGADLQRYFRRHPDRLKEIYWSIKVTKVNAATLAMYDSNSEEELWASTNCFEDCEDLEAYGDMVAAIAQGKTRVVYESKECTQGGRVINARNIVNIPPDFHDTWSKVIVTVEDVTEQKQAEEALRIAQFSIDRAGDLIVWHDINGNVVYVNETACRMLGYTRSEMLRFHVSDLDPNVTFEEWPAAWARIKARSPYTFETIHRTKSGDIMPLEVSIHYLKYGGTELICSLMRDITRRKEIEATIKAAKERAERADEAKSRFLAAASHDLRQPVQALKLFLSALPETDDEDEAALIVAHMDATVGIMDRILNAVLNISKLDAGVVMPDFSNFPVNGLLERMCCQFESRAQQKGVELRTIACGAIIYSDQMLLYSIVQNLLSNALKWTSRGKVLVGCRRQKETLRIEVWDTGPGIPVDRHEAIFEEFYQLGNPGRDAEQGLGLGLSIAKRTADLLGCSVTLRSVEGKGAMFAVSVPLAKSCTALGPAEPTPIARGAGQSGAHVLLIEDNVGVVTALKFLLNRWGFDVTTAQTREAALALQSVSDFSPDLIIADYRLPDGQGTEVVERLCETLEQPVPSVIISGDSLPDYVRDSVNPGVRFLPKPVDPSELRAMIDTLVAR